MNNVEVWISTSNQPAVKSILKERGIVPSDTQFSLAAHFDKYYHCPLIVENIEKQQALAIQQWALFAIPCGLIYEMSVKTIVTSREDIA